MRQQRRSGIFIVYFEHILLIVLAYIVNFEHVIAGWHFWQGLKYLSEKA